MIVTFTKVLGTMYVCTGSQLEQINREKCSGGYAVRTVYLYFKVND